MTKSLLPRSLTPVESFVLYALYEKRDEQTYPSQLSSECGLSQSVVHNAVKTLSELGKEQSFLMNPLTAAVGLVETDPEGYRKWCKISWFGIFFVEQMGWDKFRLRERLKKNFIESGKKMFKEGKE